MPAEVRYESNKNGKTSDMRIRLTDTLQDAQSFIANKP